MKDDTKPGRMLPGHPPPPESYTSSQFGGDSIIHQSVAAVVHVHDMEFIVSVDVFGLPV